MFDGFWAGIEITHQEYGDFHGADSDGQYLKRSIADAIRQGPAL